MGRAVLIVDDFEEICDFLALFFEEIGVATFTARDAQQAITIFRDHPEIGAIVSDLGMGGGKKDGDHLHEQLAAEIGERHVYFILVQGEGRAERGYFSRVKVPMRAKPIDEPSAFVEEVLKEMQKLRAAA